MADALKALVSLAIWLAIMLAIVGPIVIAVPAIAWWFRSGNAHARRRPDWAYSGQVELLVWSVPALAGVPMSDSSATIEEVCLGWGTGWTVETDPRPAYE